MKSLETRFFREARALVRLLLIEIFIRRSAVEVDRREGSGASLKRRKTIQQAGNLEQVGTLARGKPGFSSRRR